MAGPPAFFNDVAYNVGRESIGGGDLGEIERESGDSEIRGEIRVRVRVVAVVGFNNGVEFIRN